MVSHRYLGLILLIVFALGGCSSTRFVDYGEGYSAKKHKKPAANKTVVYHTVGKGDTLFSIAWEYGYDYRQVASWNGIRKPYTIFPGQKLKVRPPAKSKNAKSVTNNKKKKTSVAQRKKPKSTPAARNKTAARISWHWPARGTVIASFKSGDPARQGIDISGKLGQPVYAAATGKVVYSGNGLRGYGNLVIIKHDETYFSAYAHNNKIFVKENEVVKSGQRIADMGSSGTDRVMLHFEIRRNGRPSNPLKYLPKKGS